MVDHQKIFSQLKHWYALHARDLAWRKNRTPYAVWISEIMLQQTQVSTVIDFYRRWMKKFPSIKKLSKATKDEVLVLWQGLGYYKRGISILETAKLLVENHNGRIPNDLKTLMQLPGIGRYTASAILSFAFAKRQPMVEVNISRVLTRFFFKEIEKKVKSDNGSWRSVDFWELSDLILPLEDNKAVLVNEALMELGATVCKPKDPNCHSCPLSAMCDAYDLKKQNQARIVISKKNIEEVQSHLFLLSDYSSKKIHFSVVKRDENVRQGGLWCFPTLEHVPFSTDDQLFNGGIFSFEDFQSFQKNAQKNAHKNIEKNSEKNTGEKNIGGKNISDRNAKKNTSEKNPEKNVAEKNIGEKNIDWQKNAGRKNADIWNRTKKNILRFVKENQEVQKTFEQPWSPEITELKFAPAFSFIHRYTRFRVKIFVWIDSELASMIARQKEMIERENWGNSDAGKISNDKTPKKIAGGVVGNVRGVDRKIMGGVIGKIAGGVSGRNISGTLGRNIEEVAGNVRGVAGKVVGKVAREPVEGVARNVGKKIVREATGEIAGRTVGNVRGVAGRNISGALGRNIEEVVGKIAGEVAERTAGNVVGKVTGETEGGNINKIPTEKTPAHPTLARKDFAEKIIVPQISVKKSPVNESPASPTSAKKIPASPTSAKKSSASQIPVEKDLASKSSTSKIPAEKSSAPKWADKEKLLQLAMPVHHQKVRDYLLSIFLKENA